MKPDYKNWVPKGMVVSTAAGTLILAVVNILFWIFGGKLPQTAQIILKLIGAVAFAVCGFFALWSYFAHKAFSYDGKRKMSKQIVEGTAAYVDLPDGGKGLDVGCGSGALTIACAKKNPNATMVGIDRWGAEYASFSKELCENNAKIEGVAERTQFQQGDATALDFPDETFDAVTSNYVYHNITGTDKQKLLKETLRVLKKGGTFAIHDLMSKARYGDMEKFVQELKEEGYEKVELIDTAHGMFMSPAEARWMMLGGSTLLVGRK